MLRGRLYDAERRGLLERRLHGRRTAARPARAVLHRATASCRPSGAGSAALRLVWTLAPANRRLLGFIESFKLAGSCNAEGFIYEQYTLGGIPVTNAIAYVGTVSLSLPLERRF